MNKTAQLREALKQHGLAMTIEQVMEAVGDDDRKRISTLLSQQVKRGHFCAIDAHGDEPKRWMWLGEAGTARPATKTRRKREKVAEPELDVAEFEQAQVNVNLCANQVVITHNEGAIILDHAALVDLIQHLPRAQAALEA